MAAAGSRMDLRRALADALVGGFVAAALAFPMLGFRLEDSSKIGRAHV